MLFFNHATAESERWVHLFSHCGESNASQSELMRLGIFFFSNGDVRTFWSLQIRGTMIR